MLNRLKGIILTVFLISFNSIQCSYSYFSIEQCPGTEVPKIRHQTQFNEISLIFYYTQWSDESLEALQQYNDVANHFGDKVYFAAIDCWHLACNCSKTLTTSVGSGSPHKWPTLMVHYGRQGQLKIQYNGLFTFREMVHFIEHVMQPLERIEMSENLKKMETLTDAIVLGVFKKPSDLEYKHYLISALKWLEHDPVRTYRFIVTFERFKENPNDTIKLPNLLLLSHKTNKSFVDYNDFKWNATNILRWLHEELNDDYNLLHGYATPIMIAQKIKKQPVLAIFVNQPQQFFAYIEKYVDNQQPFTKALLACKKYIKRKAIKRNWKNSLHISKIIQNLQTFSEPFKCHYYNKNVILKNLKFYYEINHYFNQVFQNQIFNTYYDPNLETTELLGFFQSTACVQNMDIFKQTPLHISVVKRLEGYLTNEQQWKNSNRSLAVVLLDTQRYKDYLENIDIPPTEQSMATVFIVENEKENMFAMEDRFAMYNLMEFVKKFYSNGLNNYYKNKKNIVAQTSLQDFDIELKHLNRQIFLNYMQFTHNQTLIVLIYSPECALCGNIQHSFIQLSLFLRHIIDLKFIRINTIDNDLPWQYNMPFLPALLVFPENRFSESRLFPIHLKPDIRNLFGFILSQLPAHQQVRLVLAMCQSETLPKAHAQSCWQFAKTTLMQHIGKHLQYRQMFETERSLIFERLRAFKDMSLDIQRNLRL